MIGSKKFQLNDETIPYYENVLEMVGKSKYQHLVNPCGEISLNKKGGYCVISDLIPFFRDSRDEIINDAKLAARFLIRTNLMDSIYSDEVKRTNRIGVGLTGIHEFAWKHFFYGFYDLIDENKSQDFWTFIERLRVETEDAADEYSDLIGVNHPHTYTTIKPSGCRPWYGLTSTDSGILTYEELFKDHCDDTEWSDMLQNIRVLQNDGKTNKITKTYNNGVAEVFKIRLAYGLTLESTADHMWYVKSHHINHANNATINKWVATKDLMPNDVLDVNPGVYNKVESSNLRSMKTFALRMKGTPNPIIQPNKMNPDIAWLFGYLWGDGAMSTSGYRLRFTDENRYNLEKANRVLLENFNISGEISDKTESKALKLEIGNKELWHWLIKNGVFKYHEDKIDLIPKIVRQSSKEDIIAFIAGMIDADGCIAKSPNDKVVMLTQQDYALCRHIQDIGWSVGLCFGLSHNTCGENFQQKRKSMYLMAMCSVTELENLMILKRHSNKMNYAGNAQNDLPWRHNYKGRLNKRTLGKVEAIDSIGMMNTYDVEVENNHWYYAGAAKSHNSVSKLYNVTEGAHLPARRFYLRWVQMQNNDPNLQKYINEGYPVRQLKKYPNVSIVGFPTAPVITQLGMGDKLVTAYEASPEDQFKWIMLLEKYWLGGDGANGQVSYTMKIDTTKYSLDYIKNLILEYQPKIKCCSVMPSISDEKIKELYEYMPEENVTEEEFKAIEAKIHAATLQEFSQEELICTSGACPL